MKLVHCLTIGCALALIACSGSGGSKAIYHPDVGPFDENGDYVVALADAPVSKNKFSRSKPKPEPKKEQSPPKVQQIAKVTPAPTRSAPEPVQRRSQPVVIAQSPRTSSRPTVVSTPKPRPVVAASKPKPEPKAVVMKPKKKAPLRHTVRRTDTLYGLSRKYGVSVGSIQRANSLKGSTIVTGKTLLIPR